MRKAEVCQEKAKVVVVFALQPRQRQARPVKASLAKH
jgi:hypothetical protein